MKVEIIEEKENPLLNRREVSFKVLHDAATPSRQEVRKKLIALLNAKEETVILDSFTSRYGRKESLGIVRVYKSEARAREVESRFLIDKNLGVKKAEEKSEDKAEKEKEKEKQETKKPEAEVKAEVAPKPVDKTGEKAPKKKTVPEEKPSPKKPEKEEKKPKEK